MPCPRACYPPAALLLLSLLIATPAAAAPLTLEEAIEEALASSAEMVVAREDLVLVDADYMAAYAAIMPRFDVTVTAGERFAGLVINEQRNPRQGALITPDEPIRFNVGPFTDFQSNNFSQPAFGLNVTGSQLIYDGGRWWTVIDRVADLEAARKAALRGFANDVRVKVTRAFYELAKADRGLATVEKHISLGEAQLARAEAMLEAGRGTARDVATAARNLADDRINYETRLMDRVTALANLNLQMGREGAIPVTPKLPATVVTSSAVSVSIPEREALMSNAMDSRPDLAQLRAEIQSATKDVDIQRADYFPVVSLEANYRKNSRRPDRVFVDPTENYTAALDLVVRWNIFEGRGTTARVARARVALRKLLVRLDDTARRAESNVDFAIGNLRRQTRVFELSQRGIEASEEAVRLAKGMYEAGRGTALELRDAQLGLTNAQLTAIDARYEIEIAREELRKAVGRDLSEVR